jgi:hypothetical protein
VFASHGKIFDGTLEQGEEKDSWRVNITWTAKVESTWSEIKDMPSIWATVRPSTQAVWKQLFYTKGLSNS